MSSKPIPMRPSPGLFVKKSNQDTELTVKQHAIFINLEYGKSYDELIDKINKGLAKHKLIYTTRKYGWIKPTCIYVPYIWHDDVKKETSFLNYSIRVSGEGCTLTGISEKLEKEKAERAAEKAERAAENPLAAENDSSSYGDGKSRKRSRKNRKGTRKQRKGSRKSRRGSRK